MAQRRVVLPALKLTKIPTHGVKSVEYVHRVVADSQPVQAENHPSSSLHGAPEEVNYFATTSEVEEPTCYEVESRACVVGWKRVRNKLLEVVTENAAMPLLSVCLCCKSEAVIRCKQCSPSAYYCSTCYEERHSITNIFHVGEKWEVRNSYIPLLLIMLTPQNIVLTIDLDLWP